MRPVFHLLTILLFIGMASPAYTQTLKAYEQAGHKAIENKDYYSAMQFFSMVLEVKPEKLDTWYAFGEAARLFNSYSKAEAAYVKVSASAERENFPLLDYWLGTVYQAQGKYEEAIQSLTAFLELERNEYTSIAEESIASCNYAKEIMEKERILAEVKNLGAGINSPASDFGGIRKGDTLFYSSLQFDNPRNRSKIFHPKYSQVLMLPEGQEPQRWEIAFSRDTLSVAHPVFSIDGKHLFYNECAFINTNDLQCVLIHRRLQSDGRWSRPIRLPKPINLQDFTTTQPSIGRDPRTGREILFFVSDRPEGKGKLDIWYTYLDADGEPGEVFNLESVNTKEDEATPYFDHTSGNLYFSSKGYKGLGGFDIFKSRQDGGEWQKPEHLGFPVNSSYNDLYYYPDEGGQSALFSSNRPGSIYVDAALESCCFDLYEVEFTKVNIELVVRVIDQRKNSLLPASRLRLVETISGEEIVLNEKKDENFVINLVPGKIYKLISEHPGYEPDTTDVRTKGIRKDTRLNRVVFLNPSLIIPDEILLQLTVKDGSGGDSLTGVQVLIIDDSGNEVDKSRNFSSASHQFNLKTNGTYLIYTEKEGYYTDTLLFNPTEAYLKNGITPIRREVLLSYKPSNILTLSEFLPIPLFFDNNKPTRGKSSDHTYTTYSQNFKEYYAEKDKFVAEFGGKGSKAEVTARKLEMETFFEEEIRNRYESFQAFLQHLENYLQEGNEAELLIKGFASPLADARYNEVLTKRRTQCLLNELTTFKEGILNTYIDKGKLRITERPFGESQAPSNISDDRKDARSSVYSVDASRERRVEILEIVGNETDGN